MCLLLTHASQDILSTAWHEYVTSPVTPSGGGTVCIKGIRGNNLDARTHVPGKGTSCTALPAVARGLPFRLVPLDCETIMFEASATWLWSAVEEAAR
eukprot:scaffold78321_cov18-Tisochrysis_lutea.AAC.1